MTNEQVVICKLIGKALFGKPMELETAVSWIDVYQECIRQTIVPTVVSVIPQEAPL